MAYEFSRCTECGEAGHPWWDHGAKGSIKSGSDAWPMTTKNIDGVERTFYNDRELQSFCKAKGVRHRPDSAWVNKRAVGTNWKTGEQIYSEGSGRGMPGSWY